MTATGSAVTTTDSASHPRDVTRVAGGFTLLELLVSLAVLVMAVLLMLQMVGGTASVSSSTKRRLDLDAEARSVFDRMGADVSGMVIRPDVDALFLGQPQESGGGTDRNDQFYFYSQAPGYSSTATGVSPISLVGYRVNNLQLERLGAARRWDSLPFLTTNSLTTGIDPASLNLCLGDATNTFHVVAPSVFRMEVGLLMKPGTTNGDGSVNLPNSYARLTDPSNPRHGMANVAAVVVALGLLDRESRKSVTPAQLTNIATILPDSAVNGGIPLTVWETNLATAQGIPPLFRNRARVYIRHFPLKR
jgi:type II secretory pathway component PulJ